MTVESAADLAAFFNPDEFGKVATYTPPAGSAVACTVLLFEDSTQPEFAGRPITKGHLIEVRKSEVAAPVRGGIFAIGTDSYAIVGDPHLDIATGLIWTCMTA